MMIYATTSGIEKIDFPGYEDVGRPGWDGIVVVVGHGNAFVPSGLSVWELGTGEDAAKKIKMDYDKRSKDPLSIDPSQATYIAATLRYWPGKESWSAERRKDGIWRDVRVYDAGNLEQWLELAPSAEIWLRPNLGKGPVDVQGLASFIRDWQATTSPPFPLSGLTAGRQRCAANLSIWLRQSPSPLVLRGPSSDEACAYIAAYALELPPAEREDLLARAVVCDGLEGWRRLLATPGKGLVVIAKRELLGPLSVATSHHHVLILEGHDSPPAHGALQLGRVDSGQLVEALVQAGLDEGKARDLVEKHNGNIAPLRRSLSRLPPTAPQWSKPDNAGNLAPLALIGSWQEDGEDRKVVEAITRKSFDAVTSLATRWLNDVDAPLQLINGVWRWNSRHDSWTYLSKHVTRADVDAFVAAAVPVLKMVHPKFEMEPAERYLAGVYGKVFPQSDSLRTGIAETIAMLGSVEEHTQYQSRQAPQDTALILVRRILDTDDWRVWSSLSRLLVLLAEASPDEFLTALERRLDKDELWILPLFGAEGSGGSNGCTELLWALETLAWSRPQVGRVVAILGRLARIDPGGTLANRPISSLRSLFLPDRPQTTASKEEQCKSLDMLMCHEPTVAWQLLVGLLPHGGIFVMDNPRPKWRLWADSWEAPKRQEVEQQWSAICDRAVRHAMVDSSRWPQAIELIPRLLPQQRDQLLDALHHVELQATTEAVRCDAWHKMRNVLHQHCSFPDADWAMPEDVLVRLRDLYAKWTPENIAARFLWLFGTNARLAEGGAENWRSREKDLSDVREQATDLLLPCVPM